MAKIMGIVNVTPDSFYSASRVHGIQAVSDVVDGMVRAGASAIDVGACSTRPGSEPAGPGDEMERLERFMPSVRDAVSGRCLLSVDTFRPEIAGRCVRQWGVNIINDVSGGCTEMFRTVADTGVVYVLTYNGKPAGEDIAACARDFFASRIDELCKAGADVEHKVILDPGFGFGKTLEQNWSLLAGMEALKEFGLPLLAGLSRKSMAWKLLGITPDDCLAATVAMNMAALERGADWLRVHDVTEAVHTAGVHAALAGIDRKTEE